MVIAAHGHLVQPKHLNYLDLSHFRLKPENNGQPTLKLHENPKSHNKTVTNITPALKVLMNVPTHQIRIKNLVYLQKKLKNFMTLLTLQRQQQHSSVLHAPRTNDLLFLMLLFYASSC